MSEQRKTQLSASVPLTIDELAHLQRATPVDDPKVLEADIWDSDEELEAFLAAICSSRHASFALTSRGRRSH